MMRSLVLPASPTFGSFFQVCKLSHRQTDKNTLEAIPLHGISGGRIAGKRSLDQGDVAIA